LGICYRKGGWQRDISVEVFAASVKSRIRNKKERPKKEEIEKLKKGIEIVTTGNTAKAVASGPKLKITLVLKKTGKIWRITGITKK
jgi:outer membrane receptor for ferrienterochelin and colicin